MPSAAGDRLTVVGHPDVVRRYADDCGLGVESARGSADVAQAMLSRESGAAEVVVPPRSRFEGEEARPGHVLNGRLLVLAVQRQGQDRGADHHRAARSATCCSSKATGAP